MPNRLEPLNLVDFSGGLNLRRNQFQLAANESPEMLNVEIDPRGGIYSRKGWHRVNALPFPGEWNPRTAFMHVLSSGVDVLYLTNDNTLLTTTVAFVDTASPVLRRANLRAETLPITVAATPHEASFVAWGDTLYVACGRTEQSAKRIGTGTMAVVPLATTGSWHDDYTNPTGNTLPAAEFFEAHSGYLFAANIDESGVSFPNRLRWSHPNNPEDWAEADVIDIDTGGSKITGILSFEDHLLIFKEYSLWALYGYDTDSWQLVQKSSTSGCPHAQGFCRSERSVFYYCSHESPGIYEYDGNDATEISEPLRRPFDEITAHDNVWIEWVLHRLWVSVPWDYDGARSDAAAVFVFDPTVGGGAWVMHQNQDGCPGPYYNSRTRQEYPLAAFRSNSISAIIELEALDAGHDQIRYPQTLATLDGKDVVTVPDGLKIALIGTDTTVPESIYRTPWLDAGWPTRKKSWRRPDYICREYGSDYDLTIESYRDHEETRIRRSQRLNVGAAASTAPLWGEFEWGDGTEWGGAETSARIERGASFGLAKSLQMRILGPSARPNRWGIDAIVMKFVNRRFR